VKSRILGSPLTAGLQLSIRAAVAVSFVPRLLRVEQRAPGLSSSAAPDLQPGELPDQRRVH
jgi:hypothetical protein